MSSIETLLEILSSVGENEYASNAIEDMDPLIYEILPRHESVISETYFIALNRSAVVKIVLNDIELKTCYTRIFPIVMNKSKDRLRVVHKGVDVRGVSS